MSYTKKTKLIRIFLVGLEKGWKNNFLNAKPLFIPPCLQCSFNLLFNVHTSIFPFLFILVIFFEDLKILKLYFWRLKFLSSPVFISKIQLSACPKLLFFSQNSYLFWLSCSLFYLFLRIQRIILLQFITNISNLID